MARSTPVRAERGTPPSTRKTSPTPPLTATIVLARWRLRNTWGMLLVTGMGMIAAVMLVCAVPLYSQLSTTAGLHGVFTAMPDSPIIRVHAALQGLSISGVRDVRSQIEPLPQQELAKYLARGNQFSLQSRGFSMLAPKPKNAVDTIALLGDEMAQASPHMKLLAGRLPLMQSANLEAAITSLTAHSLNVHVGSVISLKFEAYTTYKNDPSNTNEIVIETSLPLHIVGIYASALSNDSFWHGAALDPIVQAQKSVNLTSYTALVSNEALLAAVVNTVPAAQKNVASGVVFSSLISDAYWYYRLDARTLTIANENDLQTSLATMQGRIADNYGKIQSSPPYPYIQNADISGPVFSTYEGPGTLELFRNRVDVALIPVTILMIEAVALILFFISMMAELLVERQADAIAVLRSRGASRRQVFGSFFTQSFGLGLIAFLVGPLLALLAVYLLVRGILGDMGQAALSTVNNDLMGTFLLLITYAAIAVAVALLAMSIATYRAVGFDVLAMRREAARSSARSLWQRFNLDLVAVVVALVGYGISLYLNSIPGLDAQTRVLVQAPLTLIAPTFLLLAGIFILLRIFPYLLRLGATLATRGRGASAVLALGQMSRAPRQSVRMALLLALATAFAIFSLIFTASQAQRIRDVAAYQVGADFSGSIPDAVTAQDVAHDRAALKSIRGVTSVTLGYTRHANTVGQDVLPVEIRAVDADTFAQRATWSDSAAPLAPLMQQLSAQRVSASTQRFKEQASINVPAVVDALTWKRLGLSVGTQFSLEASPASNSSDGIITFVALAEVQHIPTINDSTEAGDSNGSPLPGGVIVDFRSYQVAYQLVSKQLLPINYVWLRTSDDAALVANVRNALTRNTPQVSPLLDRRAIITALSSDPLTLDLIGELALGASTALLLALLGNLLASWLNARNRVTNFAVLRALGTSPRQVANVLTWEQGIIYITALVLGVLFGALLALTVIPSLVFTSVPASGATSGASNGEFYALQHILPVQIVVPPSLIIALVVLVVICIVTLGMMVRVVTQPALSQALRLNED